MSLVKLVYGNIRQWNKNSCWRPANDNFGASVAISGDGRRLALGALNNRVNGTNAGQARMFEIIE